MIVGTFPCIYAVWVLIARLQGQDDKFRKLAPMKQFWGPQLGSAVHYLGYVVVPFLVGIGIIFAGFRGVSLLELIVS